MPLQQGRNPILLQCCGFALRTVVRSETHLHAIARFHPQGAGYHGYGCDAAVDQRFGKPDVSPDRALRFCQCRAALDIDPRTLLDIHPLDDPRVRATVQLSHARVALYQDERGRQREQAENALHTASPIFSWDRGYSDNLAEGLLTGARWQVRSVSAQ